MSERAEITITTQENPTGVVLQDILETAGLAVTRCTQPDSPNAVYCCEIDDAVSRTDIRAQIEKQVPGLKITVLDGVVLY